jgi:osmotically inducible protein OsmC
MERKAEARWEGGLRGGKGTIRLGSGAFEGKYSFGSRFETNPGANPEELLGAAHAACFSMALAAALEKAGHAVTNVETTAVVRMDKTGEGFSITGVELTTRGRVPGLSASTFQTFAEDAKENCIVSRALASVPMSVHATLANGA